MENEIQMVGKIECRVCKMKYHANDLGGKQIEVFVEPDQDYNVIAVQRNIKPTYSDLNTVIFNVDFECVRCGNRIKSEHNVMNLV